jgi:2-polyprenyl-3-methyl-5-hydroxy-6-metoxy-1,4-benzoquinol methylase
MIGVDMSKVSIEQATVHAKENGEKRNEWRHKEL